MKRLNGMLFGSFIGDALALNLHWVYDTEKIALEFRQVDHYEEPTASLFHAEKEAGDFTHYGDQSLLLLKSIASNEGFNIQVFQNHWINYMKHYSGYMDRASKDSLEQLDAKCHIGAVSDDLSGVSTLAPLLYYHFDDTKLLQFVKSYVQMTHNDPQLLQIAEFTVKWIQEIVIGHDLEKSLETLVGDFPLVKQHYDNVLSRLDTPTVDAVKDIGQSCSCQYAFPSTLLILLKNKNSFSAAMKENLLAGGDSASRGLYIGMVLGAYLTSESISSKLITSLTAYEPIVSFTKHQTL